ncbi:hypothetical protein DNK06_06685 [Pseudomonas daroniae]|uniref:DUF1835 domain-containing protein n=1 Tax=Phytopseudomonas daroniae TaxID=2487519 RepID=A0A4Q9QQS1_9GAMM|nr:MULTISPECIES: DUF1835 domain-containing protein [Pseudomonas]TBU81462.1 hypothetical protein DNK06_06685 [Pseudomonas daroniae]TBU84373.1 hypothetical protein DNK31_08490 [Pseudomonas sp. FRB 228]TBU89833.1 hypothetical protein DNJ99_14860 [Pseudomonas daroniae]
MWHLVCGDNAVAGVTHVIGQQAADEGLRVMRDDLAVGPLGDVDAPPCAERVAFWSAVWPEGVTPVPDFAAELPADAQWIAGLTQQGRPVTVWHGDSASEQLLLARVAHALESSDVLLLEVSCGTGNSWVQSRKAVAMHAPQALFALAKPRPVDSERRAALAAQWCAAAVDGGLIHRWQAGNFAAEDYQAVDAALVRHARAEPQPLARVMAEVMARNDGFFASDYFLFWRARELAAAGQLVLSGESGEHGYSSMLARRGS